MSGIKDLHSLLFWLDNSKESNMAQVLANRRRISRDKANIMRELEAERQKNIKNLPNNFVNQVVDR